MDLHLVLRRGGRRSWPASITVFDPNTETASFSNLPGARRLGRVSQPDLGLGGLRDGAQAEPGGMRMWPGTWMDCVPATRSVKFRRAANRSGAG
jgi:hypothetical protein